MAAQAEKKKIVVTGANKGIGFALAKELAINRKCHVYLGSRNKERGEAAVKKILDEDKDASVELIIIDVCSDESVNAAVKSLEGVKLYAVVNNAGVGLGQASFSANDVVEVNVYGVKRVSEAFLPLLDLAAEGGARLATTGSGAGPSYMAGTFNGMKPGCLPLDERKPLASTNCTFAEVEAILTKEKAGNYGGEEMDDRKSRFGAYMLSKAAVCGYLFEVAREHPKVKVTCCTPGYVDTDMTNGFPGTKLTPLEGCKSLLRCILGEVETATFYGSDALRSPVHVGRDPGTEEYKEAYDS